MDNIIISGVMQTPLKKIYHPMGDVFHGMKKSNPGYVDFGEVYFSTIKSGLIKPWKRHLRMTLNLIVIVGEIRFVIYDNRIDSDTCNNFMDITLSVDNYYRLTIPPNVWMAFEGKGKNLNLLLNIADLEHDPQEIERMELTGISYKW